MVFQVCGLCVGGTGWAGVVGVEVWPAWVMVQPVLGCSAVAVRKCLIGYQMHRVSDQQCPSIQSRNYDTV